MKVKCIASFYDYISKGKVYDVFSESEERYELYDNDGDVARYSKVDFEIVEEDEKTFKHTHLYYSYLDEHNRNLCSEKKFTATKVPYMNEIVEALNDGIQSHTHTFIKANSITVPWTPAKAHNKIDRMNRCLCSEKKYISVSTPVSKEQSTVSKFVENDFHQKQHNKASIFIGNLEVF